MQSLHNDPTAGHLGVNRTLDRLKKTFYWANMHENVATWCRECSECQIRKIPQRKACSPMQQYLVNSPMERIALDILPETYSGNRYILVVGDYFSKWSDAWAMPDTETSTVVELLIPHVFCQWGLPLHIHSDRGSQFESKLFQELCLAFGISKTRTTAYHPQSDGMIERLNRTIEDMLSKYVSENQRDWDEFLPFVMLAYRTSTHDSTGFSPAMIFMGREPRLPIDLLIGSPPVDSEDLSLSTCEYIATLRSKIQKVHELASEKLLQASNRQKRNYDHRKHPVDYNRGDPVFVRNESRKKGRSPKLQPRWIGPYVVIGQVSDFVYELQRSPKARHLTVHHDRLKPFYGEFQSWLPSMTPDEITNAPQPTEQHLPPDPNPGIKQSDSEKLPEESKTNLSPSKDKTDRSDTVITRSGRQSRHPLVLKEFSVY